jgi:hypothetical protein
MSDNYGKIVQDNLMRLYSNLPIDLSRNLPGEQFGEQFHFDAFGEKCVIDPKRITLGGQLRKRSKVLSKHLMEKRGLLKQGAISPLFFTHCRKLHYAIFSMKQMMISLLL